MTNPLFSTYTQGENRVTSTVMTVFGHISNSLTEDVLEVLLDESDFSLLTIENQVTGVKSVPDAAIRSSSAIWFETKTVRDAVGQDQLERHLKALVQDDSDEQRLSPSRRMPRNHER
ncbi:hypothetical protein ACFQE1_03400 [Halobium palmae]|uniref:Uncharacterized protein n=1 Tax=Halobium palmae TaxID=1776492 RepID=A0ABD5RVH1_9EURY